MGKLDTLLSLIVIFLEIFFLCLYHFRLRLRGSLNGAQAYLINVRFCVWKLRKIEEVRVILREINNNYLM